MCSQGGRIDLHNYAIEDNKTFTATYNNVGKGCYPARQSFGFSFERVE